MTALALRLRALRPTAGTSRRTRPGPRPLLPRSALLRAHVVADRLMLDVERVLADELAPLLSEHAAPEPPGAVLAARFDAPTNLPRGPRGPLWNRPQRRRPSIAEPLEDAVERTRAGAARALAPERLRESFDRIAVDVATHTARELRRQFQQQVGVDPISSNAGLAGARERFVRENVARITTVANDRIDRVQALIRDAVVRGTRVEVLARQLEESGDVSRRRASLIARDQVLTANAQMARLRAQNAGIVEYEHVTSRDERVRPTHQPLDGQVFRYDNPPIDPETGESMLPGEPIGCRCTAKPRLEGLL